MFKWLSSIVQHDKLAHFFYATLITLCLLPFLPLSHVVAVMATVGIAKEVYDYFFGGYVEVLDFLFTLGGCLVIVVPLFLQG